MMMRISGIRIVAGQAGTLCQLEERVATITEGCAPFMLVYAHSRYNSSRSSAMGVVLQPGEGGANGAQGPATGRWSLRGRRHRLAGRLARCLLQAFEQFVVAVKDTPDVSRRAGTKTLRRPRRSYQFNQS